MKIQTTFKVFSLHGSIIEDGNMISNKSSNFFVNVGQTVAKSIPSSCKEPSDYISYNAINVWYFDPFTESEITYIIGCFKESAAGWDDIEANVIKYIKNTVCIPLLCVFPWNISVTFLYH